ncbi:hypothetical protein ACS0TY_035498 [Phlomoides rotata]
MRWGEWRGGVWCWKWRWRRELRDRESLMLNDLISVVNLYSPKQGVVDRWRWRHGENGVYSTKAAYEVLLRSKFSLDEEVKEEFVLVWNKIVIPKVRVHAWRVLWERVPTTTKLQKRRSLPAGVSLNCIFCKSVPKSVRHVFFNVSSRIRFGWNV